MPDGGCPGHAGTVGAGSRSGPSDRRVPGRGGGVAATGPGRRCFSQPTGNSVSRPERSRTGPPTLELWGPAAQADEVIATVTNDLGPALDGVEVRAYRQDARNDAGNDAGNLEKTRATLRTAIRGPGVVVLVLGVVAATAVDALAGLLPAISAAGRRSSTRSASEPAEPSPGVRLALVAVPVRGLGERLGDLVRLFRIGCPRRGDSQDL